jgi:hypothetical protein
LPFTLKKVILRQKKNYENPNISPCEKYNLQKKPLKENQYPSRYHKSRNNFKFQHKARYHLSKTLKTQK